jgi:hypothetical protein
MKSGHKGRGADKRKKAEKQVLGQASHSPKSEKRKKKPDRLEYEPA